MMTITYIIMGYCLPTIMTALLVDWWRHRDRLEGVDES